MKTIEILENFGVDPNFTPSMLSAKDRAAFQLFIMSQPGFHAPMLTPAEDETDDTPEENDADNEFEKN